MRDAADLLREALPDSAGGLRRAARPIGGLAALLLSAWALAACDGRAPLRESPQPPSRLDLPLSRFHPPDALPTIAEWHPGDWRVHLYLGLLDSSRAGRLASLLRADSLHPGEPLVAFRICLAYLDTARGEEDLPRARLWLEKALRSDPANGVLRVVDAYLRLREGNLPRARSLFMDPRRNPRGDFYYARLEEILLGMLSDCRHLDPFTLIEAVELYRRIPFPPFEGWIDILYSVFLSTQEEHPYDIRVRGRDAAEGLFRLGRNLRVASYAGPGALTGGYEQRSLGFMFQVKAAEFLTLFYRTFDDTAGAGRAFRELVDAQREYEAFLASRPWEDAAAAEYLEAWEGWLRDDPETRLADASERARGLRLWKRAMAVRIPAGDAP